MGRTMVSARDLGGDDASRLFERIGVDGEKRLCVLDDDEGLRVSHGLLRVVGGGAVLVSRFSHQLRMQ